MLQQRIHVVVIILAIVTQETFGWGFVKDWGDAIGDTAKEHAGHFENTVKKHGDNVGNFAKDSANAIADHYDNAQDLARRLISFDGALGEIERGIKNTLQGSFNGITNTVNRIPQSVKNTLDSSFRSVNNWITTSIGKVTAEVRNIKSFVDKIGKEVRALPQKIEKIVNNVVKEIKDLPKKIEELVSKHFDIGGLNDLIDGDVKKLAATLKECTEDLVSVYPSGAVLNGLLDIPFVDQFIGDADDFVYDLMAIPLSQSKELSALLHNVCSSVDVVLEARETFIESFIATAPPRKVSYSYVGCYKDSGSRAMEYRAGRGFDVNKCFSHCQSKNYLLFGVQHYDECFCSKDKTRSLKYGKASNCRSDKRGGSWSNSVFQIKYTRRRLQTNETVNIEKRRLAAKKGCEKDSDNVFCVPTKIVWPDQEEGGKMDQFTKLVGQHPDLKKSVRASVSLNKLSKYKQAELWFSTLSTVLSTLCESNPEPVTKSICTNVASRFVVADAILDYSISIAELHGSAVGGSNSAITRENTIAIIQNQLALRDLIKGTSSAPNAIKAKRGLKVATVQITDSMYFSMDVKVNSIKSSGWQSVFHCGVKNEMRLPGIWLHPDADNAGKRLQGFHLTYGEKQGSKWPPGSQTAAVYGGKSYKLEIEVTQSQIVYTMNNVLVKSKPKARHKLYSSVPCYIGDPWHAEANVEISNLVIKDNTVAIQNQLALRDLIKGTSSTSNAIKAKIGYKVATAQITNSMYFSMDIKVNSIGSVWQSVFHCGVKNEMRLPGVWLHPESDNPGKPRQGFHLTYGEKQGSTWPPQVQTAPVYGGKSYKLEIEVTQSHIVYTMNNVLVKSMPKARHKLYSSVPCYIGDPWHAEANVEISNLVIKDKSLCTAEGVSRAGFVAPPPQPNMVQLEMSIEHLAMKAVGLVFVGLFVGLLIGYCIWNSKGNNAHYKAVKFINEAGDETDNDL